MADEVQVFYDHLIVETGSMNDSVTALLAHGGYLQGGDVGVENPAHRTALRLEMHRRITALRSTVEACTSDASDIAERLRAITERYSELDVELTGSDRS